MGSAALRVPRTDVLIIACSVVENAQTLEISGALAEFADGVAIIAGEVVEGPDAARGVAADAKSEALAHSREHARRAIRAREVRPVRGVGVVAGSVDD